MDFKNIRVTTESGFECQFFKDADGTQKVICFNGNSFFENVLVAGSISGLKKGKLLKFRYYAGYGSEEFVSTTPIVSIEQIK